MKRAALFLALCVAAPLACAQTTAIVANHIDYFGGAPVTGRFCVSPTNQLGAPINLATSSGQQLAPSVPLCFPLQTGVLEGAAVPDTSQAQPANACLKVTIYNGNNSQVGSYPCIQPSGASWSFDAYVPSSLPLIPALQLPQFYTAGALNSVQSRLNLVAGSGIQLGASGGDVTVSASGANAVTSVFGRTGAVTAQAGDYTAAQVTDAAATNSPNIFTAPQSLNGSPAGNPASFFVQKIPADYGFFVYDNSGSTVPNAESYNAEIYDVTGTLTSLRANYRSHIDPSNTSPSIGQLQGFASGAHGTNAIGYGYLADGSASIGIYGVGSGSMNEYELDGTPIASVTGVVANGGDCEVTLNSPVSFFAGATVQLAGIGGATACNGTYSVLSVSGLYAFTVNAAFSGTYTSGGTALLIVPTVNKQVNHYSTGSVYTIRQLNGAMTGNMFDVEALADGTGSFSGDLINYVFNGVPKFIVDNQGNAYSSVITAETSISTPVILQPAANSTGGGCAMAASTTCTFVLAHTYTAPVCIATAQGASAAGGAVACSVSGATVTITAGASNSNTWGALVFGDPN